MRIVIAPDSYKGSLSAFEVANAMEKGILKVFPDAEVFKIPIADGGEGTVESLVMATGGRIMHETVTGPIGQTVLAHWGILGDGRTAVIEMASASGLPLVAPRDRDPRVTSSYGTGQLIRAALDARFQKIIVGIGGSATNDGGAGMASALGVRFLDSAGRELVPGGAALAQLARVDISRIDVRLKESTIVVACDVDNPLCGPRGASAVYGPQKGATLEVVSELDDALCNFAKVVCKATGKDVADRPGAGAAGGLGAGLMYFCDAILRPGVEIVFETTGLPALVQTADLIITGEGMTDSQTAFGKAPVGIGNLARKYGKIAVCLSGSLGTGAEDVLEHGIHAVIDVISRPMNLQDCMASASPMIEIAASRMARLLRAGILLSAANIPVLLR